MTKNTERETRTPRLEKAPGSTEVTLAEKKTASKPKRRPKRLPDDFDK